MKKDMKILQLVCVSIVVFFLFIFFGAIILSDALSGEVSSFGKRSRGTHELEDDPEGFWFNVLAWGGAFVFLAFMGIKGIIHTIKDIKDT